MDFWVAIEIILFYLFNWIPFISILVTSIIACNLDIKNRLVDHNIWIYTVGINCVYALVCIILGYYDLWFYVISIVAIVIYFIAMKMHFIEGADFVACSIISLFFIYNPYTANWFMALPFMIFLCAWIGASTAFVITYNYFVKKQGVSTYVNRGFPMFIPIVLSLITTVILV